MTWSGGVYGVDPWRGLRCCSGNNTMALGTLYEAFMRWLGPVSTVQAVALTAEPEMDGPDGEVKVDVPENALVIGELPAGGLVSFELSATPRPEPPSVSIFGTEGALRADFGAARLERAVIEGPWRELPVPQKRRAERQLERDFVTALRDGPPVRRTDYRTGLRYMLFTDAVVASIADGRRHRIDDPGDSDPPVVPGPDPVVRGADR